ncbi:hypothetical protein Clacol_005125 [Clathrus columnatus]|uniref:Uncharacterized protein n=1 Tax=Clathrus columnatus TaxID=1419009 RepID=A0AAV5AB26_9AGAM|nr:hypothetical protein Clacol_005125 [Clathrus columnatus]
MLPYRRMRAAAVSNISMMTITSNTTSAVGSGSTSETALRYPASVPRHLRPQRFVRASDPRPSHPPLEAKIIKTFRRIGKWLLDLLIVSGDHIGPWPEHGWVAPPESPSHL